MIRAACLLFCLSLAGCIADEEPSAQAPGPSQTLVVYLAGDNDLSREVAQKAEALRQGWRYREGSRCLVYADTPGGARLLRLRGGCCNHPEPYFDTLRVWGPQNSASAETLSEVLRVAREEYPAERYGLVFFSHASGWLPQGSLQRPRSRSIGRDDSSGGTEMELAAFAAAIPDGMLDFLILETCLSANAETAYALRRKCRWLLASCAEIVSPGFTPVYTTSSGWLGDTSHEVQERLTAFGQRYMACVREQEEGHGGGTLSLIRCEAMEPLALGVGALLRGEANIPGPEGLQHFDRPGSYGDRQAPPLYFDLGQWIGAFAPSDGRAECEKRLAQAVVWRAATDYFLRRENGFVVAHHSGLTAYLERSELPELDVAWRATEWAQALYGGIQADF